MKKKWYKVNEALPARDTDYNSVSVEVIVECSDGAQLWAFCDLENELWYRTDGNAIENVKRWRYGNGYKPLSEGA